MVKQKTKVIVAMSGGVDSSVAALLMKKKGYEVIGVFLKCWSESKNSLGECDWRSERRFAMRVANKLEIPLVTVDAEKEYRKFVVDEMFKDYRRGITPNPDVLCNEVVKFPFLLREAKKFGADYIVTGHFVNVKKSFGGKYSLYRGSDEMKDQSYFLYRLNEKDLSKMIFPIGRYSKKQVRNIAKKNDFINHEKKSTVGICFIGKMNMKNFLKTKIKPKKGNIVGLSGEILGKHDGVAYYTIGQRLGSRYDLNIRKDNGKKMPRWYVAKKDIKKNILTVAPAGHELLYRKKIRVKNFHLINGGVDKFKKKISKKSLKVYSRIRHVGELIPSKLSFENEKIKLDLSHKLEGVSNGQAVVFYKGRKVLGGGVISD